MGFTSRPIWEWRLVEDYEASDPDFSATLELDTGFMGAIGIGKHMGDSFRVEGEVGYMKADLDKFTLSSGGAGVSVDLEGESSALSFMLAGYADLMEGPAKPYFGGGLGLAMWETKASVLGNQCRGRRHRPHGFRRSGSSLPGTGQRGPHGIVPVPVDKWRRRRHNGPCGEGGHPVQLLTGVNFLTCP